MPRVINSADIHELGENILKKRLERNMTQEQLGERMDTTGNTIHLYESAQSVMKVDKLFLLADALGCSANDLCPKRLAANAAGGSDAVIGLVHNMMELTESNQKIVCDTMAAMINSMLMQQK